MKYCVVAVAYNRPDSLSRLLRSLGNAEYSQQDVELVVSIDKSDREDDVLVIAKEYRWPYGKKSVRTFDERQGLRQHVLQCGDLVNEYDGIIIFEDDIVAAKHYFRFATSALGYYEYEPAIAGIALYSPSVSFITGKPFYPAQNGADVFFMQVAQSWGQCFSRDMWHKFRAWYRENDGELPYECDLPDHVRRWPKSSWLKYFMRYLVRNDRYFVYPYVSQSTNFSDPGEHNTFSSSTMQVPMQNGAREHVFSEFRSGVKYDIFFERQEITISGENELHAEDICVDLYGSKKNACEKRFVLTPKKLPFETRATFGLEMRPHEANIESGVAGKDVFLYDLGDNKDGEISGKISGTRILHYYYDAPWRLSLRIGLSSVITAVRTKLAKLRRKKT